MNKESTWYSFIIHTVVLHRELKIKFDKWNTKECPFTPSCMTSKRLMKKKPSRICKNSNEFLWNQRDSSWHISWCVYENNDNAYKYCIRLGCLGIKSPNGKIIWPNSLEFVKFGELAQSSSREIWKKKTRRIHCNCSWNKYDPPNSWIVNCCRFYCTKWVIKELCYWVKSNGSSNIFRATEQTFSFWMHSSTIK